MTKESLKNEFEKEIEGIENSTLLTPEFQKRNLLLYFIRTCIAMGFFFWFWEYRWMKWVFLLYLPLNLFSLFSIAGWKYFMLQKISKTRKKLKKLDADTEK